MTDEKLRERLQFRSWRRGTREMDLLLGSFADRHLHAFTPEQLARYEVILEQSDPDLYNWVTGKDPVPMVYESDVMELLCAHQYADKKAG